MGYYLPVARRYIIKKRIVSPKGEGDFPGHEDLAYAVYDAKKKVKGPINVVSTLEAAKDRVWARKRANVRRKNG